MINDIDLDEQAPKPVVQPELPVGYRHLNGEDYILPTDEFKTPSETEWRTAAQLDADNDACNVGTKAGSYIVENLQTRRALATDNAKHIEEAKAIHAVRARELRLKQSKRMAEVAEQLGIPVPEKPATAGEGYRFVEVGEKIAVGDQFYNPEHEDADADGWRTITPDADIIGEEVEANTGTWADYNPFGFYRRSVATA